MSDPVSINTALTAATGGITAMAALGSASFGLVDATKAFGGGVSNVGLGYINKALTPFQSALDNASPVWRETVRANWINGVAKDDQKTAVKSLIRLGISSSNAAALAKAGKVDATALETILKNLETGVPLDQNAAALLGRFNAVIDVAMDAGFERADQAYRNASKVCAGLAAILLSFWAGYLLHKAGVLPTFYAGLCFLVGLVSVPIAPVAKDLASSLQAAGAAVSAVKK